MPVRLMKLKSVVGASWFESDLRNLWVGKEKLQNLKGGRRARVVVILVLVMLCMKCWCFDSNIIVPHLPFLCTSLLVMWGKRNF